MRFKRLQPAEVTYFEVTKGIGNGAIY